MVEKKIVTASKIPSDTEFEVLYEKLAGRKPSEAEMVEVRELLARVRAQQEKHGSEQ